jgi:two-component system sensor histidine kinase RegB
MWVNFAFSAVLIAWFVVRMAVTMREQDRAIARIREEGMRNEQIISVASIAAGAAHELRTPLATMTVLADELRSDHPEVDGEMAVLQGQLERCDAILGGLLSATADGAQRRPVPVRDLVDSVLDKWGLARPEVNLQIRVAADVAEREIEADVSLVHALLNFLNNAADASPDDVRLAALRDGERLLFVVEDRGPGIPADVVDSLGKRYISRKEGGLGLGVLLSSASIERLDGEVALLDRPGGGARLEIRLPLRAVEAAPA